MKHKFEGGMTTGTADDPAEGYSYCAYCCTQETDENKDEECWPIVEDQATEVPAPLPNYEG